MPMPQPLRPMGRVLCRSLGRRMLRKVPYTQSQIAVAVGVAQSAVCAWKAGEYAPDPAHQALLDKLYGIPPEAWALPANKRGHRQPERRETTSAARSVATGHSQRRPGRPRRKV